MAFFLLPLLLYTLAAFSFSVSAAGSAWNGLTTPEFSTPSTFRPYYVPPGAKGYDSSSRLVHYSKGWFDIYSREYVGNSLRQTLQRGAFVSFTFFGTGCEYFGNSDRNHGLSTIYMDGQFLQTVDAYSDTGKTLKQQRLFWIFDLPLRKHTIQIVNTASRPGSLQAFACSVDAFVVYRQANSKQSSSAPVSSSYASLPPARLMSEANAETWTLEQKGTSGVNAMQLVIISTTHALLIDKVEHNPLTVDGHPAWAALYNIEDHSVTALNLESNSFCAGGTFLSNGTLINVGGNPVVADKTGAADFGDVDGLQAIRLFKPCPSSSVEGCTMYENPDRIRMASPRWYSTALRIEDGSAMIIGGSKKGGWMNNATTNNPTLEYFPPKSIHGSNGLPINMSFLQDTLNSNLFPIAFALPDGKVFIAANRDATIYDWKANTERRLPSFPNGVRVTYPMAGTAIMLPISPDNNYAPEILICGGSSIDDEKAGHEISSSDEASAQCCRMTLTDDGIAKNWEVDNMPEARLMPDAVLLPTGIVVFVNGAGTGISGYGNVLNQVGASNADHPALTPVLYNPSAPRGARFSRPGMPTSDIPRMYHSTATLTPRGDVMIAGSNPNLDRSEVKYGTEYRVEWLKPPYMTMARPQITNKTNTTIHLEFGQQAKLTIELPAGLQNISDIKVALMDFGFVTHAVHANSRLVYLIAELSADRTTLTITGPPNGKIYPPGPGWVFVVVGDVPSVALPVMVGDEKGPPVDEAALKNVLENTKPDQSKADGDE
ncbi:copper radical oxidase [Mycena pura]|uniref:Copper radical oxidase n=1 Tax=Mycena pura TaxID=153505 RepID=A0AAD6YJP6_9AGAR|nr:copper radical oxidase [Mycena pura]